MFRGSAKQEFASCGISLSLISSTIAVISGFLSNRRMRGDQQRIFRLLVIADEASKTYPTELEALEREFKDIVAACVRELVEGTSGTDQAAVSIAIEHARCSIEGRKAALSGSRAQKGAEVSVSV